ncbi:hypothetical protein FACS1894201_00470 [Bacteroidia bacterium]|nr:hypothetical protein FACS1894201_00470 [Bacteroidia bacterium]
MENPFKESTLPQRSGPLTLLCVLTFIGSGFTLLSNAIPAFFYDTMMSTALDATDMLESEQLSALVEQSVTMMEKAGIFFFIVNMLLNGVSLLGAIGMWKVKTQGFQLYVVAQLLLLLVPMTFGVAKFPATSNIVLTLCFITLYVLTLRNIGLFRKEQ